MLKKFEITRITLNKVFHIMQVTIGPLQFTSGKAAVEYTRNILTTLGKGATIPSTHPQYSFFVDLLHNHQDVPRKIGTGISSFGIQRNKRDQKCLETFILRTDGTKETFSWVSCAKKKFMTPEQLLYKAFRHSIEPQISEFKKNKPEKCEVCKQYIHCEVDHKNPTFYQLTQQFLKLPPQTPIPTTFGKKTRTNEEIFLEKDSAFSNEWCLFHKQNATLQYLCEKCHKEKTVNDSRNHALLQSSEIAQVASDTSLPLG